MVTNQDDNTGDNGTIRLTFPDARLLVVDDIATNLKIAEGLLAPYRIAVDTCLSGLQAIEMVKQAASGKRNYDIVLMDHLMPEMDGIEATALIRAWENSVTRKQVPIIALTANAVVGMREMFIEKGFNDFLSKPIDMSEMDEMLARWIPKEKILNSKEQITNKDADYSFLTEIEVRRLDKLNHYRAAFELDGTGSALKFDAGYYRRFVSVVESFDALPVNLKADRALLIEAGRNEDAQKIHDTLPAFYENLAAIYRGKGENAGTEMVGLILQRLKKAILDGDTSTAGKIVTELGAINLSSAERELYFKLYDSLMDDDTAKALEIIERHLVD
jgi:CheY-like chemotaxis protein